jgi:hypothetical protein
MARKKITNLFNKNHVSLIKVENDNNNDNSIIFREPTFSSKKNTYGNFKYSEKTQRIDTWVNRAVYNSATSIVVKPAVNKRIVERLKSPLGFYYTKVTEPQRERKEIVATRKKIWRFYIQNNVTYELIYYTEYNGAKVGFEKHPWELADTKSVEDHLITALIKDLETIISDATTKERVDEDKLNPKCRWDDTIYHSNREGIETKRFVGDMTAVKKEIFTDLFGYPDGPKYQTNEEKILAHGFDLKTSFRKM